MRGHLAKIKISSRLLLRVIAETLPPQSVLIAASHDHEHDELTLIIESPHLPETDMRRQLPIIDLTSTSEA